MFQYVNIEIYTYDIHIYIYILHICIYIYTYIYTYIYIHTYINIRVCLLGSSFGMVRPNGSPTFHDLGELSFPPHRVLTVLTPPTWKSRARNRGDTQGAANFQKAIGFPPPSVIFIFMRDVC